MLPAVALALVMAVSPAFTLQDPRIDESSGLAVSSYNSSHLLTHNDSGGRPEVYVVDSRTGRTVATLPFPGATNVDWEDIAVAGRTVYAADIGDNDAKRASVVLYAMPERGGRVTRTKLTYDDGPHDAEALLVSPDGRTTYIVTKQLFGAGVYRVDGAHLRHVDDLPDEHVVTGASWSPDGRRVALVSYVGISVYDASDWPHGKPQKLPLPPLRQAESIAWAGNDALWVGSEGTHAPVYRVAVPAPSATPASPTSSVATAPSPTAQGTPTPRLNPGSEVPKAQTAHDFLTLAGGIGTVAVLFGGIALLRVLRRRRGGLG